MSELIITALQLICDGHTLNKKYLINEMKKRVLNCEIKITNHHTGCDLFVFDFYAYGVDFHVEANIMFLSGSGKEGYINALANCAINGLGRALFAKKG